MNVDQSYALFKKIHDGRGHTSLKITKFVINSFIPLKYVARLLF